ncbi:MAG: TetR family transcriptional regulator [Anaerolineae bacterium]|nr:TetR family transcriptional regulator [Anaerolineae bacterium]NIN98932.1 TetR family transcriptional regulator [Anaerolineae bacterium]
MARNRNSRDAVLRAATDLFTQKGFANTSVRDICQEAGVTHPALYYHLRDKDGMF